MHSPFHISHRIQKPTKREFELGLIVLSSVGPLASTPQIIKIYESQSAGDLSIYTWSLYLISGFFWMAYGVKLKSAPLIINNIMWMSVYMFVLVGILRFS